MSGAPGEGLSSSLAPEFDALTKRVTKLERALRIYADPDNWGEDDWGVQRAFQGHYARKGHKVGDEAWLIAQKALR